MDEKGRITLISQYQRFINRYPMHPYAIKAQEEINDLAMSPEEKFKELGFVVGGESLLLPYERKFSIDKKIYKKYLDEWFKSGPYREFDIAVIEGDKKIKKNVLAGFDIPADIKNTIQDLLEKGKLIFLSEAAFKNKDWQSEKFLVFDPKIN